MSKLFVDEIESNTGSTITISDSVPTLKTGTIKSSGGTTALSIDTSGRVQRNVQPYFFANGHGSSKNLGSNTVLSADNACFTNVVNTGSHMSDAGIFTCPVAGMYLVTCTTMDFYGVSTTATRGEIFHNSTVKTTIYNTPLNTSVQNWKYTNVSGTYAGLFAATDTIKVEWEGCWYGDNYSTYVISYLG
jgi:hypothetical protein